NYLALGTFTPAYSEFGVSGGLYDYPGSYWLEPGGMDALDERKHIYLMHLLIGHHGFFLLTPILLVSLIGLGRHLRRAGIGVAVPVNLILLAGAALVVTDIALQGQIASSVGQTPAGRLTAEDYAVPRGWPLLAPLVL